MTRRTLIGTAVAPLLPMSLAAAQPVTYRGTRIATSTYSYWHFKTEKYPIERVIENAAKLGFDGVEILHRQMAEESPGYCNRLKQLAFKHGLALPMLSIHQDFVHPDVSERRNHIAIRKNASTSLRSLGFPQFV